MDDPDLYEAFLQEYPGRIYEEQIHSDDSGERDEPLQFWISGLCLTTLFPFLDEYGSGNYVVYHEGTMGKPIRVHRGMSRVEMN